MSADLPLDPAGRLTGGGEHAWRRLMPVWHVEFGVVVALTAVWAGFDAEGTGRLVVVLALYAALAGWYATIGVRALRCVETRQAAAYLVGACALFIAADAVYPGSGFLLFALVPQCFMLLELRPAFVTVLGLVLVSSAATLAAQGFSGAAAFSLGLSGLLTVAFAVLIGFYIDRIVAQSSQRAQLIADLEQTRAQLAEVSREAGVLAERQRLAREIHDTLAQGFSSLLMLVQAADAEVGQDPAAARRHLGLAERTARENLTEARSLVAALTPHDLQTGSLGEAIERLTGRLGHELGIVATAQVEGPVRSLPANAEVVLLRAAQEALTNVRKHAAAHRVEVRLGYDDAAIRLEVRDDGRGFDPDTARGFGLRGMRARIEEEGGSLCVTSRPGAGTTLRIVLP